MTREELHSELHRLNCGHKWCGRHGYIFHPEKTGGVKIIGTRIHIWGCCVSAELDFDDAAKIFNALPDGAGHKRLCDAFREAVGQAESPQCLHCHDQLANLRTSLAS